MTAASDTTRTGAYDVERIRADFPILYREVYGKPLVYLDNGASAQKPRSVIDAIEHAYELEYANVHRGLHFLSNTATARFEMRGRNAPVRGWIPRRLMNGLRRGGPCMMCRATCWAPSAVPRRAFARSALKSRRARVGAPPNRSS